MFEPESWWKIETPRLRDLVARQHPLPSPRQRHTQTVLWELDARTGTEALEAASTCARAWVRELDQEPPWRPTARTNWDERSVWIWTLPGAQWQFTVIGAAAFEHDTTSSRTPFWRLAWLWLHPYARHRGNWAEAFPLFLQRYQLLQIVPLTSAMRRFVAGRPTRPVQGSNGEILRLFSQEPGCPRHPQQAMWQHSPGLWLCGVELEGGDICKEKWAAPVRQTKENAPCQKD